MAETYTFEVPGIAADAIHIENVLPVALLAGVPNPRISYTFLGRDHGYRCRITCSRNMALCLVEAFRRWATRDGEPSDIVVECGNAIAAVFSAIGKQVSS